MSVIYFTPGLMHHAALLLTELNFPYFLVAHIVEKMIVSS
jgi:hypothetical protein